MTRPVKFSARTAWDRAETRLTRALTERRGEVLDLTASNPTQAGFVYDEEAILSALAGREALIYDPNPKGIPAAREAVSRYYADHGVEIGAERIFLTTSTSEAYSYLFRLLCDPGDEVLIAQPSYPLFDFLAQLESVRLTPYALFYDHGWRLDVEALRRQIRPKTRAIALVHPNNPTGHFTKDEERREVEELCREYGLALVVDEVFLDYGIGDCRGKSFGCGEHPVLTFVLSGLSKIAALPQMKAAWIASFGPEQELGEALERLEIVADTFLSMNAPVQNALPAWLGSRSGLQAQILQRVEGNLRALDEELAGQTMVSRLEVEAGWYAVLRVPALEPAEDLAVRLVREYGVSVYPGYFFGLRGEGWLVVSLLAPAKAFLRGIGVIWRLFSEIKTEPQA